jgi:hypothetical protein
MYATPLIPPHIAEGLNMKLRRKVATSRKDNIKVDLLFLLTSEVSHKVYPHDVQQQTTLGPSHMKTA